MRVYTISDPTIVQTTEYIDNINVIYQYFIHPIKERQLEISTCLVKNVNNPNITKYSNIMPCPMCRYELPTCCCGFDIEKYQQIYGEPRHELDYLENFEMLKDLLIPEECYECKKYLGMNNNCEECKKYQVNGHVWA